MSVQFGVVTTSTDVTDIKIQSVTANSSVQTAQALDESGNIIAINGYSAAKSGTIQGLVDGSVSISAGDTISFDGETVIITGVDRTETNTGYAEVSLTYEGAPGVTPDGPSGPLPST